VGVSVPDGSLTTSPHGDYILFANTWPEADFISYDPFTYKGLIDILKFTEKHGDKITKEVVFNQVGVSLENSSYVSLIGRGIVHPDLTRMWVRISTAVAQKARATVAVFFLPTLLFIYNTRMLERMYEDAIVHILKNGRTEFAYTMKEINNPTK